MSAASNPPELSPGESSGVIKIPSLAQESDPASLSGRFTRVPPEEELEGDLVDRVLGNYRLGRSLGGRGLCTVYEARALAGGDKRFAVKVLRNANFNQAALDIVQRRFVQEARVASRLHHPHICDVVDFGTTDGLAYMVAEFLEGESLRETLRRHGPLPWTRVLPMFLHICDALEAAHAQGVIHRDLKPSNCFRVRSAAGDDFIKVLDFGLARIVDEDLPEGLLAGGVLLSTPEYMAPELIRGAKPDPRVDIYGVGVLLYELLTGTCPFKSGKQTTVLAMQLLDTAIPPRRVAPDANIPSVVERVILKALSKAPEERYQNVMEMRVALLDDTRITRAPVTESGVRRRPPATSITAARSVSSAIVPRESSVGMTVALALVAAGLLGWVFAGTPGLSLLTGEAEGPAPSTGGAPPATAPKAPEVKVPPPVKTDPAKVEGPPVDAKVAPPPVEAKVEAPPVEAKVEGPPVEAKVEGPPVEPDKAPPDTKAGAATKSGKAGSKEPVNFDIEDDPGAPIEVSEAQIDGLLRPYRPAASQCGRQHDVPLETDVHFKLMLSADGRLTNIKPVGRPASDPAVQCMVDLIKDAKLEVPAGSKFKHAFFDYSFRVY